MWVIAIEGDDVPGRRFASTGAPKKWRSSPTKTASTKNPKTFPPHPPSLFPSVSKTVKEKKQPKTIRIRSAKKDTTTVPTAVLFTTRSAPGIEKRQPFRVWIELDVEGLAQFDVVFVDWFVSTDVSRVQLWLTEKRPQHCRFREIDCDEVWWDLPSMGILIEIEPVMGYMVVSFINWCSLAISPHPITPVTKVTSYQRLMSFWWAILPKNSPDKSMRSIVRSCDGKSALGGIYRHHGQSFTW